MSKRIITKSHNSLKKYGLKETARRSWVFLERKIRPSKYFHFEISSKKSEKGNILFVSGEPKNATSYYRCEIPRKQLEQLGWGVDIVFENYSNTVDIDKYSIIIFYRTPLAENEQLLYKAREKRIRCLFSVDDLVYRRDLLEKLEYTQYLFKDDAQRLLDRADGMVKLMQQCDAGIASTDYIARDMSSLMNKPVFVNRNGFLDDYSEIINKKEQNKDNDKVIIGYFSGSETHDRDLALIWSSLRQLLNEYQNVELYVGGRIHFDFEELNTRVKKMPFMPRRKFMEMLASININLLPLEDTEFNRGKSEIKFIEAGLVRVPTVASSVGDLMAIITEELGVVCSNREEWFKKLEKLVLDKELRRKLGNNAREFILREYNIENLGKELEDFLLKLPKNDKIQSTNYGKRKR